MKKTTVQFSLNLDAVSNHPDVIICENFLARAIVTEDNGGYIDCEIVGLWHGLQVPATWHNGHFEKVRIPSSPLISDLENAAINWWSKGKENHILPDEIKYGQSVKDNKIV